MTSLKNLMEIILSPSGKIQKFCFYQNAINLSVFFLHLLSGPVLSLRADKDESPHYHQLSPPVWVLRLGPIRSCDSTAFHGGSKCDDSYFRQKHKRKAQIRRCSLSPNHCSSSGTEGSGKLRLQETEVGTFVTAHAFGSEGILAVWRTVFPPSVEECEALN